MALAEVISRLVVLRVRGARAPRPTLDGAGAGAAGTHAVTA
jgi:hypothetical protein